MFKTALKRSHLLLIPMLLAACAPSSEHEMKLSAVGSSCKSSSTTATAGIVAGTSIYKDSEVGTSTVIVVHTDEKDQNHLCTGTLIAKDKVLTAAHCLTKTGKRTNIFFVDDLACMNDEPWKKMKPVEKAALKTDHDFTKSIKRENAGDDLAVLKFTGKLPSGFTIRSLPSADFTPANTEELIMAGYGRSAPDANDHGTLRATTASVSRLVKSTLKNTHVLTQPNNGVCVGDSGGPLYVQTTGGLVLIGITSMGYNPQTEDPTKVCNGISLFSDVRSHLDWIQKQIVEL